VRCNSQGAGLQSKTPLVSVIIPTFNSERTIERCCRSVKHQSYSNIEIVVVDRHSSDSTLEIAGKSSAKVWLLDSERSVAKNFGVAKAKGGFIMFIDSDMALSSNIVDECVELCLNENAEAVIMPELPISSGGFFGKCRTIEKSLYSGDELLAIPRFFTRKLFQEMGGFDESLIYGEDADLYARIKKNIRRIIRAKTQILHLEGDFSWRNLVLKAYYYGENLFIFLKKNPLLGMRRVGAICLVRNIKLMIKSPVTFLGVVLIKIVEYMAYLVGVLSSFIKTEQ